MKKLHKTLVFFLPLVAITSCGYSLSYIVPGDQYNSVVFTQNYYKVWNPELKNARTALDVRAENSVLSFADLGKLDPKVLQKSAEASASGSEYTIYNYADEYKMNSLDQSFNYGVPSKLFDGKVECDGKHQNILRMQTLDEGFSVRFSKEGNFAKEHSNYMAIRLKSTTDNTKPCLKVNEYPTPTRDNVIVHDGELAYDLFHNSSVELTVSLYTKNDSHEIVKNSFTQKVEFLNNSTNNGSRYTFIAFDLNDYNLSRIVGFSVKYTYDDELIKWNISQDVPSFDYALFLYELFIPYTSWN